MSFNKLEFGNCLFLICPTDYMENVLNRICSTKAFFYMSLGASFSWDIATQKNLIQLIEEQKITQIVFVTKYSNLFYKEVLEPNSEPFLTVYDTLLKLDKTLPDYFLNQSHPILRVMLLASRHLQSQQKHILETSLLGNLIKQKKIITQSFVYHPNNEVFYTPKTIENKVLLYGDLSPN
ncbi:hypothetical protein SAMN04487910_2882 [Aquimarina amphilecti]|uniref:Uncharacterized protein n=1 Tax=Aquimarina amphilecti TaxID=1038014 RepID=A0A1H7RUV3_AQUAM|nr:hypothetical protein [Aquimarina amphilecti]SEL63976.1 hypothetical protein SAMN04487910_2882 [Aquimarina amphilecti]